jgi:hypothetical protein
MSDRQYELLLVTARRDLKKAYRDREDLDRKIAMLRQTVVSLGALCKEDSPLEDFKQWWSPRGKNLTDAVTNAICGSQTPVTVTEIRNILEDLGYRFQSSNPQASIHSIIKRLIEQKLIAKAARRNPDGTYDLTNAYWYGDQQPPEPWVFWRDVALDKTTRKYALKPKPEV